MIVRDLCEGTEVLGERITLTRPEGTEDRTQGTGGRSRTSSLTLKH